MKLLDALRRNEGKTLEFKRAASSPQRLLQTVVAFADTAGLAHRIEQFVVLGSTLFQIQTEVKQGLAQHLVVIQDQRNQQAPDTAIAIEKWVDGFELQVRQCCAGERRVGRLFVVKKLLKRCHAVFKLRGRRGYEMSVAGPAPSNPILAGAEFSWLLV